MRMVFAAVAALVLGLAAAHARAPEACGAPGYFMHGDSLLERVSEAVDRTKTLKIVVFGTTSSMLGGPDGARDAYPARLEVALRKLLPAVAVNVVSVARPRQLAEKMVKSFDRVLQDEKPSLAIWQTGTFDAIQGVDPREFLASLAEGIEKMRAAGVDVILINMQYNPRTENIIAAEAYLENMRWVAREHRVPLFDRLAIMRYWNDTGAIDLHAATKDIIVARQVHDCIGQALASLIIDAGRLSGSEGKPAR